MSEQSDSVPVRHGPDKNSQFLRSVFPAELEEINNRRRTLKLPEVPADAQPSPTLGLVGLALSGGGIRSATFSLGVIQALAKRGVLPSIDYLSTVSGGGFIGSCLSSLLNDPETGPQQGRFPLRYEVGSKEPLAVGQLREGARYLAPGGFLDALMIPALMLRGVLSNLFIFLLLVVVSVLLTELVYEIGSRLRMHFSYLPLSVFGLFAILVVVSPLLGRLLRHRASWARRKAEQLSFTLTLLALMCLLVLIPTLILIDQLINVSWSELRNNLTADVLRPFEPRDYPVWLVTLAVIALVSLAGRASKVTAELRGKVLLVLLGILGPAMLFTIYLGLLAIEIDSPFISPRQLFRLDATYAVKLDHMNRVTEKLRRDFQDNDIPLSSIAEVVTLEEDFRWLIRDGRRGFELVLERGGIAVSPDFQYALNRGAIPPELRTVLERKGFRFGTGEQPRLERENNRFSISGAHVYTIEHDASTGDWSIEQVVSGKTLAEMLQGLSMTIPMAERPRGVLMDRGVSLSDDDLAHALRFAAESKPHDVVVLIDNSRPPFADEEGFERAFRDSVEQAVLSLHPAVRMAVFWFDGRVHGQGGFESLSENGKREILGRLFAGEATDAARLDFRGEASNIAAALERAMREFRESSDSRARRTIILISDGVRQLGANGAESPARSWNVADFSEDARLSAVRLAGIPLSSKADFGFFATMARTTGGEFFPVFEQTAPAGFEDLFVAMEKVTSAAKSELVSPLDQLTVTDRGLGTRYTFGRAAHGVRVRVTLPEGRLGQHDLAGPEGGWADVLAEYGVDVGSEATITPSGDTRWIVRDPYRYTLSRSGRRLKVRSSGEDWGEGLGGLIASEVPRSVWDGRIDWLVTGAALILLLYWVWVDINRTAAHTFYRDKLSKAFLFRESESGTIEHDDSVRLSELNRRGSAAPYHLINVALNLQGVRDPGLRGRVCDFFLFSKRFIGSVRTGFLRTQDMEKYDSHLNLGTAMAISGAAAAPNAGTATLKSLVFILTLLNVRLGYWLPNPRIASDASWLTRLSLRRGPGPKYVLKESVGHLDAAGRYVNVSDGGHIENLGVFELLRRRCRIIIAVDGERDPEYGFKGLVTLMLYARIDLGIEIDIDLDPLRSNERGLCSEHWAIGSIRYAGGESGTLVYIKSSLTGDEYEYIRRYRSESALFPHESTAEQFFSEAQFEAYRALGYHIGDRVFSEEAALAELGSLEMAPGPPR